MMEDWKREYLEKVVKPLEWRTGSNCLGNYCLDATGYQITYFDEFPNKYYFGSKAYKTLDEAKAAAITHQLQQIHDMINWEEVSKINEHGNIQLSCR